jgi:hypothetical protein
MLAAFVTKRRKKAFLSPNIFIFGFIFIILSRDLMHTLTCMHAVRENRKEKA